jgi:hypothetical protein
MRFGGMLAGRFVIALGVMLRRGAMRLGGLIVVIGGLGMGSLGHIRFL